MIRISTSILLTAAVGMAATAPATFNKEVLPILQKNCQSCHRPGEIAPFSLVNYSDARPWAKSIKTAVATKKMPPWFADGERGHFANDMRLSDADIKTLVAWVDAGAPEGNAKDKPAPVKFNDGWNIKPDLIVEMPKPFSLPAKGTINYQYILVKTNFPEDMWISQAEMRPGNNKVVHHGKAYVRTPGSTYMAKAVPGEAYEREKNMDIIGQNEEGADILAKFNPGLGHQEFNVPGSNAAVFVPKGSDLVFEMHYTASGQPETDASKIGFVKAKYQPQSRYYFATAPAATNLVIPPNDPNAEVVGEVTVMEDNVKFAYVQPHMHLRGKDYEIKLIFPTGETQSVFKGKWDFNWQQGFVFAKPIPVPKGTRILGIAHFDNSANNPYNPDPSQEIRWGWQNWDEMNNSFIGLVFPKDVKPGSLLKRTGVSQLKPVAGKAGPTMQEITH